MIDTCARLAELRRRLTALESLATHLTALDLAPVERLAGPDTWTGPVADRFLADVRACRARIDDTIADVQRATAALRTEIDRAVHEVARAGVRS